MTHSRIEPNNSLAIDFVGVHKWYGSFHALRNINLSVKRGERIVVCGPSGSGKSTLIRCVNRLEEHQRGSIVVDGVELTRDVDKSMRFDATSEWCSRVSISFRT